jgi:hypothetical protein
MKKLLLALLAVGGFASANAQKNTVLLYGNAGYASSTVDYGFASYRTQAWGINPGIGYQFTNHMTIGLQGGYNNVQTPLSDNVNTQINKDWSVGGFWRFTHYVGNVFFLYNQMNLSYVSGSTETEGMNNRGMYSGVAGSWFPAIGAFVYKGLALNFNIGGVGFRSVNGDAASINNGDIAQNDFAITIGRQINMGVSLNIGCHGRRHHGHHGHHDAGAEVRRMKIVEDEEEADDDYSAKKARLKAKREKQKVRIKSGDDEE